MSDSLDREACAALLTDVHVGVLGISRRVPAPLLVPVWYLFEDEVVRLIIMTGSLKHKVLLRSGFASLCVQEEQLPYRYTTVEGPVSIGAVSSDFILRLATRYLGAAVAGSYAPGVRPTEHVLVELSPERWLSDAFPLAYFGLTP